MVGLFRKNQQVMLGFSITPKVIMPRILLRQGDNVQLPDAESKTLLQLLTDNRLAFCLEEGETDLVQAHIKTEDAAPKRQAMRCLPFTVQQEVAKQLNARLRSDHAIIESMGKSCCPCAEERLYLPFLCCRLPEAEQPHSTGLVSASTH